MPPGTVCAEIVAMKETSVRLVLEMSGEANIVNNSYANGFCSAAIETGLCTVLPLSRCPDKTRCCSLTVAFLLAGRRVGEIYIGHSSGH